MHGLLVKILPGSQADLLSHRSRKSKQIQKSQPHSVDVARNPKTQRGNLVGTTITPTESEKVLNNILHQETFYRPSLLATFYKNSRCPISGMQNHQSH